MQSKLVEQKLIAIPDDADVPPRLLLVLPLAVQAMIVRLKLVGAKHIVIGLIVLIPLLFAPTVVKAIQIANPLAAVQEITVLEGAVSILPAPPVVKAIQIVR